MAALFTKGPWETNTAGSAKAGQPFKITEIYVFAPDTQDDTAICADVIDPVTQEPSQANANLIAAAPDLYEALKLALKAFDAISDEMTAGERYTNAGQYLLDSLNPVRSALAKAEGTET